MPLESLDCPNCGAPLPEAGSRSTVICAHCGSYIRLSPAPRSETPAAPAAPTAGDDGGPPPSGTLERSQLASVTLGPADAAHITGLLRNRQKISAIQYFQDKVGGTLGEAKDAIEAIEAALRDAAMAPPAPASSARPPKLGEVIVLLKAGRRIEAVKAYRDQTGVGLREAVTAIEGIERQMARASGGPIARAASGWRSCASILGVLVIFLIVIAGGCGVYLQTKPIYGCSMRAIKAAVAERELLEPPINGGYLVLSPGFSESASFSRWDLDAEYFAPVWGADGFGVAHVYLSANSSGYNAVEATLFKDGRSYELLPLGRVPCG